MLVKSQILSQQLILQLCLPLLLILYGIDWDWNSDGANLGTSAWRIGRTCGGQVGTTAYDVYADGQVTSISFHVGSQSVVGAQMTTEIYEGFGTNSIFLQESDPYQLTPADIGNWVTIPLLTPLRSGNLKELLWLQLEVLHINRYIYDNCSSKSCFIKLYSR